MTSAMTSAQIRHFEEFGYVELPGVFGAEELDAVLSEYETLLDAVASELFARNEVEQLHAGMTFRNRYVNLLREYPSLHKLIDIALPSTTDMSPNARVHNGGAVFHLLTHPGLLDFVESIVGPEICASPIQHIRIKPPDHLIPAAESYNTNVAHTTWHQDAAVVTEDADATDFVTVWTAVTDSTPANGCLLCIPESHRRPRLTPHVQDRAWSGEVYIPDELIDHDKVKALPAARGTVILLHRRLEHASLRNASDELRISLDFRYHPVGQPSGRSLFPEFVVRSAQSPGLVVDLDDWKRGWIAARDRIARGEVDFSFNSRWPTAAEKP